MISIYQIFIVFLSVAYINNLDLKQVYKMFEKNPKV